MHASPVDMRDGIDPAFVAFEFAQDGLVYTERRIIRRANAAFAAMFSLTPAAVEGLSLDAIYPSPERARERVAVWQSTLRIGPYGDERLMMRHGGQPFWCCVRGRSLTPDDPFARGVFSFSDLSARWMLPDLSPRSRQVALLLCEGLTAKEIARDLGLSFRTVEACLARLKKQLRARNVVQLVSKLHASGVVLHAH